jgi:trehalose 6-phosphate phosphatase
MDRTAAPARSGVRTGENMMSIENLKFEPDAPGRLTLEGAALFLDLDGTLAPIAERPQDVRPDPRRTSLLERLSGEMDGRLAVISGRSLEDIDRILEGCVRPVSAVHGLVRRRADGVVEETPPHSGLRRAGETLRGLAAADPRLLVEDKGQSVALHYRQAPDAAATARQAIEWLAAETGLWRQDGAMVHELRTPGPSKGDSVRAFLAEAPFQGARPVFVGDDLTDEHGFAAAASLGGFGVLVGPARGTAARFRLRNVDQALDWLEAALCRD